MFSKLSFIRLPIELLTPGLFLPEYWQKRIFKLEPKWQFSIALMLNILSLALPIMMLQVYDRIIPREAFGTLIMLIFGVSTALLLEAILRGMRSWLIGWTAASNEHAGTCAALERFFITDFSAFAASGPGAHLQRIGAISRLREFYSGQALTAMIDLPFALLFLGMIAYLGGILVLVPILLLVIFAMVAHDTGISLRKRLEARSKMDDQKGSFLITALTGIHTAKAMSMESQLLGAFEKHQENVTKASYRVARASGLSTTLSTAFSQLSQILTAIFGSILVLNGDLSMGGLSACTLLVGRALQPVQRVMGTWLRLQDFTLACAQASEIFSMPERQHDENELPIPDGKLVINNMSFGYHPEKMLLNNISLEVSPGEVIAISGEKGAGKSTLLQIMAGVLTPNSGEISIDGINPAMHSMEELNNHVCYLPQLGTIFKGTILENMTGFCDREEVVAITKHIGQELGLDAVVDLLPKGYSTMLTDTTADPVPPGVKQRIALARVLKNMSSVILFDDADRALDKEGYNRLFKLIGRFKGKNTIIMVSHDQNLLSFADRFYHLENGTLNTISSSAGQKLSMLLQPLDAEDV